MFLSLIALAVAVDPPSLDTPVDTGVRARRDAALVVGNEDFAALPDATGATRGADLFADFLVHTRGVDPDRVHRVANGSTSALRAAIAATAKDVKRGGRLWVYWSGHGAVDAAGGRVLLGAEATADDRVGVALADVVSAANASRAKDAVALIDVGFGGEGRIGEVLFPAPVEAPSPIAGSARVVVWSATTAAEPAKLYPATNHGIFTYFAVGALRGWADEQPNDNLVTVTEAQAWVAKVIRSVGGGEQKPTRDLRAEVGGWNLSAGPALLDPPSKEDLAALALAEKARRVKKAERILLAAAADEWTTTAAATMASGPVSVAALTAYIAKYDTATVTVDGAQVAVAVPQVAEARKRLDDFERVVQKGKKKKKRGKRVPVVPPPSPTEACRDLVKIEPAAIIGELTPELVTCIEARIAEEAVQTTRSKLSRVLLINADARGDVAEWTRLAERHLEEVDRSDPDLCFKYALLLSRGGIEDAETVLHWSSYALENKHEWEGPTYISRVYNLLRLRAETAVRLWHEAEEDFLEERSDENADAAERFRGQAKDFAREWLDYGRVSAQPIERALVLCQSASGSEAFCEAG